MRPCIPSVLLISYYYLTILKKRWVNDKTERHFRNFALPVAPVGTKTLNTLLDSLESFRFSQLRTIQNHRKEPLVSTFPFFRCQYYCIIYVYMYRTLWILQLRLIFWFQLWFHRLWRLMCKKLEKKDNQFQGYRFTLPVPMVSPVSGEVSLFALPPSLLYFICCFLFIYL